VFTHKRKMKKLIDKLVFQEIGLVCDGTKLNTRALDKDFLKKEKKKANAGFYFYPTGYRV